ncbi:MAG TPA: helicase-related protein, partial [Planctomycetota bacterium]|nr:helicase-related protein [Planctomycetota bacterium]
PPGVPVLATTATANSRVVADVAEQLGTGAADAADAGGAGAAPEVLTIRGPLARASLRLGVLRLPDSPSRLAWLLSHLDDLPGSGIIYTLTVAAANDTARLLRERGYDVRAYTGQTDPDEREESEALLKRNGVKALIATSALGMGFDKPDLGFVVHLGAPSSPVAYYQQVGRAGRATESADVLLVSPERLNNPSFREQQLPSLVRRIGLLVVDEAHCISDGGHDFRPDYRRLRDLIAQMPPGVPVLATTATANSRVVADVAEQLGGTEVLTIRGPLARASLRLGVLRLPDSITRLAWLLSHLDDLPGSGIIYTLTVSAANDTARLLRERGHDVRAYTGQTD